MLHLLLITHCYEEFIKDIYEIPSDVKIARDIIDYANENEIESEIENENDGIDLSCIRIMRDDNNINKRRNRSKNRSKNKNMNENRNEKRNEMGGMSGSNNTSEPTETVQIGFISDGDSDFKDKQGCTPMTRPKSTLEQNFRTIDTNKMHQQAKNTPCLCKANSKCYIMLLTKMSNKLKTALEDVNITHEFSNYVNGLAFCTDTPIDKLKSDPNVLYLEEDRFYYTSGMQLNVPNHFFYMMNYRNYIFNNTLFDNYIMRLLPFKYLYKFFYSYYKYKYTGRNVEIYMIDTSVNEDFEDYKGRVINMCRNGKCGSVSFDDMVETKLSSNSCIRHGTSVADLIVGRINGFAKEGRIKVLNVFDCDGKAKLSSIISAIETIAPSQKSMILNMSINGPHSNIFNHLLSKLPKNMILITASGNNSDISCNYSPGSSPDVINVGSVDEHAKVSKFSNFGSCVRIYSLGEKININKDINGTSYSAALVAGSVAIYLESNPYAKSVEVWKYLADNADLVGGSYLVQRVPKVCEKIVNSMALKNDAEFYWGTFILLAYLALFIGGVCLGWLAISRRRELALRI